MEAAARGKRLLAGLRGASSSPSESPMGRHVVYVRVRVRVCEYSLLGRGPAHSFGLTSDVFPYYFFFLLLLAIENLLAGLLKISSMSKKEGVSYLLHNFLAQILLIWLKPRKMSPSTKIIGSQREKRNFRCSRIEKITSS